MEGLEAILIGRYFLVPNNQRGFSWEGQNIEDVTNDLILADSIAHYFGPLIVTRDQEGDLDEDNYTPSSKCFIEDGQQRLTAFFLLINSMRQRLIELDNKESLESRQLDTLLFYFKGGSKNLRMQNSNPDLNACFSNLVVGDPPMPGNMSAPMRAMENANEISVKFFSEKTREECLQWKNRLTRQARFILVDLDAAGVDRYLTFDAINSRGLPLSQFDKIKNFCILIDDVRNLNQHPDDKWYHSLQNLDVFRVSNRGSEEAYITELYNIFHNVRISQNQIHTKFVEKYKPLLDGQNTVLETDLISFMKTWEPYSESYGLMTTHNRNVHYGTRCTRNAGHWLDRLDNMELPTITRPLLVVGHMALSTDDFEKLAEVCEKYTFRVHGVLGKRKDNNSARIISLANDILKNLQSIDYVINIVCDWLSSHAPLSEVVRKLSNGEPKYNFAQGISGWPHCYYFLYEYEIYVSPTGVQPLPWGRNREEKINTQEHVLPQSHRDGGWWEKSWDEYLAEKYKHRLGNLVLTNGNDILSRKPINLKINDPTSDYDYTRGTNSERLIVDYTKDNHGPSWDDNSILQREYDLLKFAVERWSVPCCSDNNTIYLEGIDDIYIYNDTCYSVNHDNENDMDNSELIE